MAPAADRLEHLLLDHILAGQRNARSMFLVLSVCGGLTLLIPAFYLGPGFSWTMKWVLCGVFVGMGALFLIPALRAPENHPILEQVRRRPSEIVWIYVSKQTQYGAPVSAQLVLGLKSGRRMTVHADLGREHELMRAVGEAAPSATLGYQPALEAAFRQNPRSLLQN
jgi:hypothetical protein